MKSKEKDNSKGITLVVLVITIVVLLILVGVTITTITGQNGIIANNKKMLENKARKEVISNVEIDILSAKLKGKITEERLEEILSRYGTVEKSDGKITGLKVQGITESIPIKELFSEEINNEEEK